MIDIFVQRWEANKDKVRAIFTEKHPDSYLDIVKAVVSQLTSTVDSEYDPNPEKITVINDGDYQGTLLFVIPENTYQPYQYFYVKVNYGSCSGCDTLQGIKNYSDEPPTQSQINDYMTLALHIVQGLKKME